MTPPKTDKKDQKSRRFVFNISRDIELLKAALQHNPWQLGKDKWASLITDINDKFQWGLIERTVKDRIALLVKNYETQSLTSKTGTEEEKSERGELLESIIGCIEEAKASINALRGASDDEGDTDATEAVHKEVFETEEGEKVEVTYIEAKPVESPKASVGLCRKDRQQADADRDKALKAMGASDDTQAFRPKRAKVNPEDELIKLKAIHDMDMEKKRLKFDEEKAAREFDLENSRIQLELRKEERLAEEGKRREEQTNAQMVFNNSLLEIVKLIKKD